MKSAGMSGQVVVAPIDDGMSVKAAEDATVAVVETKSLFGSHSRLALAVNLHVYVPS